jgi:hypothetical protein
MVFKMLILLGFFTVPGGFFIHSDIHRSVVDRVDYPVHSLWFSTWHFARFARFLCAECGELCARNMLFSTD